VDYLTPYPLTVNHVSDATFTGVDNSSNTVNRFWNITRSGGVSTIAIKFTYVDDGNTNPTLSKDERPTCSWGGYETDIRAQRWNASTNLWLSSVITAPGGQSADATSNYVQAVGVSTVGIFALAKGISPLPLDIISFEAKLLHDKVNLTWNTASEITNKEYVIERSSDGKVFAPLSVVKSLNSQTLNNYSYSDDQPLKGISYYRLKEVEYDNSYSFSDIKYINTHEVLQDFSVGPNPVIAGQPLLIKNNKEMNCKTIEIFDAFGKKVYSQIFSGDELLIPTHHLKSGIYTAQMVFNGKIEVKKIMVQ
jgi:hypothetical protein